MKIIKENCCECGSYLPSDGGFEYLNGIYCKDCLIDRLSSDDVIEQIDYDFWNE